MSLYKEQLKENGSSLINKRTSGKWYKRQYNKYIRRVAKDIEKENPLINRYRGWVD